MSNLRPMLAAKFKDPDNFSAELELLEYPIFTSPKIDGIRFIVKDGVAMSRSWKPLPNKHFQKFIHEFNGDLEGLDGEVIVGDDPTINGIFNMTQSAIMTSSGTPKFTIFGFDCIRNPNDPFYSRTEEASNICKHLLVDWVQYTPHIIAENKESVLELEASALSAGFEGLMLRHLRRPYKYGRSTLSEQGLIKIKRFADDEAIIIDFEPLLRNHNQAERDAFGLQKRSSHQSNLVADNLLGNIIVRSPKWGDFSIGSGFDEATRIEIWNNREKYLHKTVCFKYQPHGTLNAPRTPVFKGFRYD